MAEDADQSRREIKRRILMADRRSRGRGTGGSGAGGGQDAGPFQNTRRLALIMTVIAIPLVALTVYLRGGSPDAPSQPVAEREDERRAAGLPSAEERALIEKLALEMRKNPENLEGWALLGSAYIRSERYDEAVDAFANALEVAGPDPFLLGSLGEALVLRDNGLLTDESRFAFKTAAELDPSDSRARYFLALDKAQTGDLQGAVEDWATLLEESPADAPWRPAIEAQIREAGRQMIAQLGQPGAAKPSLPSAPAVSGAEGAAPQLDPETMAAAEGMSADDQAVMIRGMVDGLAARLADDPNDLDGWLRLARSYVVLGETDKATDALATAEATFADDFAALTRLTKARGDLGLAAAP